MLIENIIILLCSFHFRFEGYSTDIAPNEQEEVSLGFLFWSLNLFVNVANIHVNNKIIATKQSRTVVIILDFTSFCLYCTCPLPLPLPREGLILREFFFGVCCPVLHILTLFQTKTSNLLHLFSHLASENCNWFASPLPCPSEVNVVCIY